MKKALIEVRDCSNIVATFGDDELKEAISHLEISQVKGMLSEVQRHINLINQREALVSDDSIRMMINDAMQSITINFKKIGEEELKVISGGIELNEKLQNAIRRFTENIDPDDPEYITLREAFRQRFHEHGFELKNMDEYESHSKYLDEIIKKLAELQKKNSALLRKYNGDAKFLRVHKRIREENAVRKKEGNGVLISEYDDDIVNALNAIKLNLDLKVYDRNDILKKDAYFEQTVMTELKTSMDSLSIASTRDDRNYIKLRIAKQYLEQYNETYGLSAA